MMSDSTTEPPLSEFEKYFQTSEEIGWRATDFDWKNIDVENISEADRQIALGTAIIEHGVPHYAALWQRVEKIDEDWNLRQFAALWAGEEHRHSFCLKRLADVLGIRSSHAYYDMEQPGAFFYEQVATAPWVDSQRGSCPSRCYGTVPGMLVYTIVQELRTWRYYFAMARATQSQFCRRLFMNIAKDEMRHHVFYSNALASRLETTPDRPWFEAMAFDAFVAFKMPHLLYPEPLKIFTRSELMTTEDYTIILASLRRSLGKIAPIASALDGMERQLAGPV